jgi:LysM repeat protein
VNRRDTIIVAVLLNAAIIAVLLIMAVNSDEELLYERPKVAMEVQSGINSNSPDLKVDEVQVQHAAQRGTLMVDLDSVGLDSMLSEYSSSPEEFFLLAEEQDNGSKSLSSPSQPAAKAENHKLAGDMSGVNVVEIVVKRGDSLDKIARANNSSIEAIRSLNQLKNTNLSIGQKLSIPVNYKKGGTQAAESSPSVKAVQAEGEYYTIKSGDTPWKIAKQQQVSMDAILRLNHLNEEKARNLKIGDRIRIR